ncbi:hypothetical protein VTJ04DRAFT_10015 [Mycothermus thermophilus]|uniref:uncharacterized protein n=1 Tax=Humicola insolens TaxID=85995 RepID=UPI0037438D1D
MEPTKNHSRVIFGPLVSASSSKRPERTHPFSLEMLTSGTPLCPRVSFLLLLDCCTFNNIAALNPGLVVRAHRSPAPADSTVSGPGSLRPNFDPPFLSGRSWSVISSHLCGT